VHRLQVVLSDELQFGLKSSTPNMFVIDVQDDQRASILEIMRRRGLAPLEEAPLVRSRISHVKDRALTQLYPDLDKAPWWVGREYVLTYRDGLTSAETLAEGRLWAPGSSGAEVSMETATATRLGLRLGDWLTLDVLGEPRRVQVTSLRAVRWSSMRPNFFMVLPPAQLEPLPRTWFMVTRVDAPDARAALQRDLIRAHSNLTVLDLTLGLGILREFMTRLSWVVRLTAGLCVLGGLLVMAASILMTRRHRSYECAVLKSQGASRRTLLNLLAIEYGVLGAVAGLVGSAAATAGATVLGRQLLDITVPIDFGLVLLATLVGGLASAATGALSSRGVLERPALEILRDP
jgi:putative ABC transport system permease protein